MSTSTKNPPVEPPKPEHHDEFTGAFGFFRKYQKLILYSAGIFALITFSITGAMTQWVRGLTSGPTGPMPTISVRGQTVSLEIEDQQIGGLLSRNLRALPPTVLPDYLWSGESADQATRFAILRRASIACGLDVSMTEVDAAIDWFVRLLNGNSKGNDSATQIALQRGMTSLAQYRALVKEGLRIGNFAILNSLGIDTSDAAVMAKLLKGKDREKIKCLVATFDMKALEEELKQKGDVTEEDVRTWMEAKSDAEKSRLEVFDTNKVALLLGVVLFDTFDATEWTEELDKFEFGEQQQKQLYQMELERFKDDAGKQKPMDDADVGAQLKKIAQVNEVLNKLLATIRERRQAALKAPTDEQLKCAQELAESKAQKAAAQKASDAAPDDEELKAALRSAEEVLVARENAAKAADEALAAARKDFDFRAAFTELAKGRAGTDVREIPGSNNATALKDLSAVELGTWQTPELATSLRNPGDLGSMPARAQNGGFLLQATDVVVRPMKPWDEIKEHLQEQYFREQAKKAGDEHKQKLADELLRLGKEQAPEKVAEIEQKQDAEIERKYTEWEEGVKRELASATETLARLPQGTQAYAAWEQKKSRLENDLKEGAPRRTLITANVKGEIDSEVRAEAKKHYAAVLEAAAQSAGFTVTPTEPYRRDLRMEPQFDQRYPRTVVFLWGGLVNELKVDECTDVVEDTVERRWQIAACQQVEPLTVADITRREFSLQKLNFAMMQTRDAMSQSFSLDALKERYHYAEPQGRLAVDK